MTATEQTVLTNLEQIETGPNLDFVRAGFKNTVRKLGGAIGDKANVPVEALRIRDGYNVRLNGKKHESSIERLTQSILENGFRQDKPLTCVVVKEDDEEVIYVVAGHRRLEAVRRANLQGADISHLPIISVPEGTNETDLTFDLVLSNDGEGLGMYEQGFVNERLVSQGHSISEIARRQGFTEGHIRNTLDLRAAPRPIVQWLADGVIAETFALETMRKHGSKAVQVIERGLEKAVALGKSKVTTATTEGPKIPPKVGVAAVSAVESFMSRLDQQVLAKVVGDPEAGVEPDHDAPVTVPAGLLRELMVANKEIIDFRNSLTEKEEKAKERLQKSQERDARRAEREARKAEKEAKAKAREEAKLAKEEARRAKEVAKQQKAIARPQSDDASRESGDDDGIVGDLIVDRSDAQDELDYDSIIDQSNE